MKFISLTIKVKFVSINCRDLIFEKAYCYYRANKHEDALKTIEQNDDPDNLRIKELKAQILYRLENFTEAAQIYEEIIKNTNDDYEDERQTNLCAALVYTSDPVKKQKKNT